MDATPIVRIEHLSKHFTVRKDKSLKERVVNFSRSRQHVERFEALKDINLEIDSGSTVGLIGANGSGKSTLLKMIGGIIQPSSGTVMRRGRLAALLELGAGFHPDLTGRENVFLNASILGLSERQTSAYFDEIVAFSGIADFIDTQVKFYSSGMYVRLAFAVAVHVDPDLLLVDEVLAVGDEAFQQKCLDKIRSFQREGRTIVLVTHTMSQITDLCTRGVLLAKGNVLFDGAPTDAVDVLRGGFRAQRDQESVRLEQEERARASTSRKRVRDVVVRLVDDRGDTAEGLELGQDGTVEVSLEALERIDEWNLGLQISTPMGQLVLFTTAERLGATRRPLDGRQVLRFQFPALRLGDGEYTLTAALESEGEELARVEGTSFRVAAPDRTMGPAITDVSFEQLA